MARPLEGIRVLDFSRVLAGPHCSRALADLGAEVIRVDRHDAQPLDPGHRVLGRGRRSIALDLKQPAALDIARQLVSRSDGLIEGFRPGVMERLG
ncbi:MAG: CoA transferase, partial [Ilumatobacteraceae bacterium]